MTTVAFVRRRSLVSRFRALMVSMDGFMDSVGRAFLASREYQRLSALSDAMLAREGLTRDGIVAHVGRIVTGRAGR